MIVIPDPDPHHEPRHLLLIKRKVFRAHDELKVGLHVIRTEEDGRGLNARRSQFRIIDHRRNQFPVFDFGFEVVGFRDSLRGFRELLLDECPDFGVKGAHRAAHREDTGNDIREFVLPGVEGADTDPRGPPG